VKRFRVAFPIAAAAAAAGLAWSTWAYFRPRPTLAEVITLAKSRRFDEAQALALAYLGDHPDSHEAHVLMAQLALDRPEAPPPPGQRPDPKPALAAVGHLERIVPGNDRVLAALVELYRGKAEYRLGRMDDAEASWNKALRLNPTVPEAGWCLLELDYLQGRPDDARRLALRLHAVEPDPRDRVQFLLELLRQDAQPLAPGFVVQWFEPVVRQNPADHHAGIALGLALVRVGRVDEGLALLRRAVRGRPGDPDAWDAWLAGLDEAGQIEAMARALTRLPAPLASLPRFAGHKARVAQEQSDWKAAAREYRRAARDAPHDRRLEYRLCRALRNAGEADEADRLERRHRRHVAARTEVRSLYEQANADKSLGVTPHPDLYQRLADLRERMALPEEALAWHRLVLRDSPDNPPSLAATERLGAPQPSPYPQEEQSAATP
jgi:tetratricopeptide (TPR) repeat protein